MKHVHLYGNNSNTMQRLVFLSLQLLFYLNGSFTWESYKKKNESLILDSYVKCTMEM